MDAERWQRVGQVFSAALELPADQREAYLEEACGADLDLKLEVQGLLGSHKEAEKFIDAPAVDDAMNLILKEEASVPRGQRIGPYEIIREIGRGGMGSVYLAARADDEYRKRVALKIIKPGMDSEDILRRFRNERQILASLDHPNIARLLDGGTTPDGLPFFVMEYIEGLPLTDYCDSRRLSTPERLNLFRKICAAVQHAHQNLVVHRDLKPNNILVTAGGEPKLLDFGIAKFMNPELAAQSLAPTVTMMRVMTPDYASPEQVRGLPITTASDVYSLGVLLYVLLTGHHPYQFKTTLAHEIERVVCEKVPERPSTIITRTETRASGSGDSVTITPESVSSTRDGQPARLRRALRGDLDNIILMAMRKEQHRRYPSVSEFSEDIRRHLEGMPIIARPNVFSYRAAKFIKRNRIGVAAASFVLLSLVAGIAATLWQAERARGERAKAEAIKSFLAETLNSSNPLVNPQAMINESPARETTVSQVLDDAARRLENGEFQNQPEIRAELEQIIGTSYMSQGKYQLGRSHLKAYVDIVQHLYGPDDPRSLVAAADLAGLTFSNGDFNEAEGIYSRVLPPMREAEKKGSIAAEDLAGALNNCAYLRRTEGKSKEAEALFRESLALNPRLPLERWGLVNGTTMSTLASTIADQGRFDEALATAREGVAEYQGRDQTGLPSYSFALTVLGGFLVDKGQYAEADRTLAQAESMMRQHLRPTTLWLGDNLRNQALSLYQQQKYLQALDKAAEAKRIYLDSFGPHYDQYPTVLIVQGLSLARTGKVAEGEDLLREALKIRTDSLPPGHYWIAAAKSALAECLMIQRRYPEAEPLLIDAYNAFKDAFGPEHFKTLDTLARVVDLYDQWKKPALADQYRALLPKS